MPKEKLDALFNIFSKPKYSSDKEKGSGVALVICKDFVERMRGRIWAESEPGKGTTFLYALPLKG
jgi:signal transduction histidine kinase